MQQAIYNNSVINSGRAASGKTIQPGANLVRWIARKWELVGVLALMGSSAAYGVFALARTGL